MREAKDLNTAMSRHHWFSLRPGRPGAVLAIVCVALLLALPTAGAAPTRAARPGGVAHSSSISLTNAKIAHWAPVVVDVTGAQARRAGRLLSSRRSPLLRGTAPRTSSSSSSRSNVTPTQTWYEVRLAILPNNSDRVGAPQRARKHLRRHDAPLHQPEDLHRHAEARTGSRSSRPASVSESPTGRRPPASSTSATSSPTSTTPPTARLPSARAAAPPCSPSGPEGASSASTGPTAPALSGRISHGCIPHEQRGDPEAREADAGRDARNRFTAVAGGAPHVPTPFATIARVRCRRCRPLASRSVGE